jgi:hypothetical protein
MDQELVLVNEIKPVKGGRELAATKEDARRVRIFDPLHA